MKKQLLFIINPRSGVAKKKDIPALIHQGIDTTKFDVEIKLTEYGGHAKVIAAEAVDRNIDSVIAVGGDGSINEISSALVGSKTILGILPMGSGNGLARHLGIPLDIPQAISLINNWSIKTIDGATANDRFFVSMCGIGFDGFIANQFQLEKKRGIFTYIKLSAIHYFNYKPSKYLITIDGNKIEQEAFIIAIANANQFGSNFKIAPMADLQDGLLHCCVVKQIPWYSSIPTVIKGFIGKLKTNNYLTITDCKTVTIESNQTNYFHLDGEPMMVEGEIKIAVVKDAVRVISA